MPCTDASDLARGITEEHIEATKEQVSDALASVDIDEAARAATEAAQVAHGGP